MFGGTESARSDLGPVNALIIRALMHYFSITATISKSSAPPAQEN